jgi:hypothetical protein
MRKKYRFVYTRGDGKLVGKWSKTDDLDDVCAEAVRLRNVHLCPVTVMVYVVHDMLSFGVLK